MNRNMGGKWLVWRKAETGESPEDADRAFAALARQWPRGPAPAGLTSRIAALGVAERGVPAWQWSGLGFRALVGAGLVISGVMLGTLSGRALGTLFLASLQMVAVGCGNVLAVVSGWGSLVMAVGLPVVRAAHAIAGVLVEPLPMVVLLVNVLIASAALVVLRRLMAVQEV